jgi:lambda family phage portal protein
MKWPWSKTSIGKRGRFAMLTRGFAASQVDRLVSGWRYDGGFTPSEVSTHLDSIRGRSRQMAKDSPHFKRWLDLVAVNVVGEGFAFKSTPHDGPAYDMRLDETAAKTIEYHWWKFCNYRDPLTHKTWFDVTGLKTASEMDRLNARTWKRDGEYFMQIVPTNRNPYGIAFRVLRPDWCDHTKNESDTGNGTLIHCGVEMEIETRRPVAYWFHTNPKNAYAYNGRGQPLVRIPANQIIHGFTQEEEGQPRGIPHSYTILRKLKMLERYDEAELAAAIDEACTVRTYEASNFADPDGFADLTKDENIDTARALTIEKEPGQSEIVPAGYSMKVHTPQHPNREVTAYKAGMLRDVSCGFGVEYSGFANDWAGVSFSSVRVGTIAERDMWMAMQSEMSAQSKTPQFLHWLRAFLSHEVSGQLPIAKFDKFAEHEFRGRRWMWVDPMKDMNAAKMAVDQGWKTNTDVAADMGGDYSDNLETAKRERENREKTGFVLPAPPNQPQPIPEVKDDEDKK